MNLFPQKGRAQNSQTLKERASNEYRNYNGFKVVNFGKMIFLEP